MRQRPMRDLLQTLNELGADCRGQGENAGLPITIAGRGLKAGLPGSPAMCRASFSRRC